MVTWVLYHVVKTSVDNRSVLDIQNLWIPSDDTNVTKLGLILIFSPYGRHRSPVTSHSMTAPRDKAPRIPLARASETVRIARERENIN